MSEVSENISVRKKPTLNSTSIKDVSYLTHPSKVDGNSVNELKEQQLKYKIKIIDWPVLDMNKEL